MGRVFWAMPSVTYHVVKRTVGQRFFFLPTDRAVKDIMMYTLARAAAATGVEVHALMVMSDHVHAVVTDHWGRMPEFTQLWFSLAARALNSHYGRTGEVFERREPGCSILPHRESVLSTVSYVHLQALAAGLLKDPEAWPGACTTIGRLRAGSRKVARPDVPLFRRSKLPDEIVLRYTVPPAWRDDPGAYFSRLGEFQAGEIERLTAAHRGGYVGLRALARLETTDTPTRLHRHEAGSVRPLVMRASREVTKTIVKAYRLFVQAYRAARDRFRDGDREVVFPFGTWRLARYYGVTVGLPPP